MDMCPVKTSTGQAVSEIKSTTRTPSLQLRATKKPPGKFYDSVHPLIIFVGLIILSPTPLSIGLFTISSFNF